MFVDFKRLKQVGVIVFGGGLDHMVAIADAKARGFTVLLESGFASLWLSKR